jgi:hypothetical protein
MAISRAQLFKELLPGLNALFGLQYKQYVEEHKEIYEIETSERSFEEEEKLAGFAAAPQKPEGESITYDNAQEVWTARYNHVTYAMGFSITEEAMEDNLYDSLAARYTKALARSMAYTVQVTSAGVLNNGFTTFQSGDGVTLFNTSHPLAGGQTISNTSATNADLNEAALEAAIIQIAGWTDERGLLIASKAKKLIIPPNLMFVATRLLQTELRTQTGDNDISALVSMNAVPGGYKVNHYLTNPLAWFIITDVPNGFKFFQRTPLTTGSDSDFSTGNYRYRARQRFSVGISDYLQGWGSQG